MIETSSRKPAVIIGAGGHARVVAAAVAAGDEWHAVCVLDTDPSSIGEQILGVEVEGTLDGLSELAEKGIGAAFLASGNGETRAKWAKLCEDAGINLPALIHPSAVVDPSAKIGDGSMVCAGVVIGPLAALGQGVLINTNASVDHESEVGDFATISPAVAVAGRCVIGQNAFLGIGSKISDRVTVGKDARVGAGAVALGDVAEGGFVTGIPARPHSTGGD
ncbi:NeuD/PglB/VioB family sugar acetyltransferase [Aurantiacibacter sp. D1-12]|uniref:NeuD/PglB/VioB family sugar acetyltransferase n=1 Tax=Aurantiacibacter sp. D1-12 TaxID=2993658 RepID=UPI00237CB2DF|nr:NeuD/PglB/VioB family sugar acetyltransferase [Aurantiacibacter sp. D1-12]MDE1466897.1 NeuD/PglB/VioB family sugar acetyltransferase [Aurantiacibacter sp. D1-12]